MLTFEDPQQVCRAVWRPCLSLHWRPHRRWRRWYWTEYLQEDNSYLRCFDEIEICERESVWVSSIESRNWDFFLAEEKGYFKLSFHWMPRIILKLDLCYSSPNDWNHRWLCCAGHMQMFWLSVSIESEKRLFDPVMQEREMWGVEWVPRLRGCSPGFTHFIRSFLGSIIACFVVLENLSLIFYNRYRERFILRTDVFRIDLSSISISWSQFKSLIISTLCHP